MKKKRDESVTICNTFKLYIADKKNDMPDLQILQSRLQNKIRNRKTKKNRLTVQNFVDRQF